ncbi:MAG TPA: glutathione peroxidase [Chitinophagaceae bacterium]|jgi:glutathione peroxidase|nr:glutathione peroxidase [Chitinophagaceae bacterium]
MKKLKRFLVVLLILIAAFAVYVEIVNRNSKNMTYRQKVLKAVYPAFMWWTKLTGKNTRELENKKQQPAISFYSLKGTLSNGDTLDFATLKGKKILLVNTASNCGYTNQYSDLQKLSERYKDKLVVIGFPANDFKEQEKGTDEEIAGFCKANFGISFPLMKKSTVIRSPQQHPVYQWLTDPTKNGWNNQAPSWNFSKYIVNEEGILTNFFGSSISPLNKEMLEAIKN